MVLNDNRAYLEYFDNRPPIRLRINFDVEEVIIINQEANSGGWEVKALNIVANPGDFLPPFIFVNYVMIPPTGPSTDQITFPLEMLVAPKLYGKHIFNQLSSFFAVADGDFPVPISGGGEVPVPRGPGRLSNGPGGGEIPSPFVIGPAGATPEEPWFPGGLDLTQRIPLIPYAQGVDGGPRLPSEAIITSADSYRRWLGDIDPGFNPQHNILDGVDFSREFLVGIAIGESSRGTSVSLNKEVILTLGGIMGGTATITYTVVPPFQPPQVSARPYCVARCQHFSGFNVRFIRRDALSFVADPRLIPDPAAAAQPAGIAREAGNQAETVEILHGANLLDDKIQIRVTSTGGTDQDSFRIGVISGIAGFMVTVYRVRPDNNRMRAHTVTLTYNLPAELNGNPFTLQNDLQKGPPPLE